jgi:hypothetical protein
MLRTEGYMMKKVWENGNLREDVEMSEKGNDEGVRLVIRDKNVVEEVAIPREAILRAMFNEKPSSQPLTERLVELVDTSSPSSHHSSVKTLKAKAKRKTKKAPKKPKRKTARRGKKTKQQSKKTRGKKLKMVCRME